MSNCVTLLVEGDAFQREIFAGLPRMKDLGWENAALAIATFLPKTVYS